MYSQQLLSPALTATIGSESIQATTISRRAYSWLSVFPMVLAAVGGAIMIPVLYFLFLKPMTGDNQERVFWFVCLASVTELGIAGFFLRRMFQPGGVCVITRTRLLVERGAGILEYAWSDFSYVSEIFQGKSDSHLSVRLTHNGRYESLYLQTSDVNFLTRIQQRIRENRT